MSGQIMQGVAKDAPANDWRTSGKLDIRFDQGLPCLLLTLQSKLPGKQTIPTTGVTKRKSFARPEHYRF
jgi:hypothetical protein